MSASAWGIAAGVVVAGACASALVVARVRRWAEHRLLDVPNDRSSHVHPTPRGGGLGVVVASTAGLLAIAWWLGEPHWAVLASAGLLVAALGFADDLRPLPAVVRLVTQLAIVVATLALLVAWGLLTVPPPGSWTRVATLLVVVWVVGLMNAYNFMDGIDGIAGLQALVAGLGWALVGSWVGATGLSLVGLAIAGAALGFLRFNWPPARIFMGDVGSVYLGFLFAMLALLAGARHAWAGIAGALLVWPFVFDASVTFLRRAARGENVLRAHRTHLYQRLVGAGWTHRRTTMLYGALAAVGVFAASLCLSGTVLGRAAAALVTAAAAVMLWLVAAATEPRGAAPLPVAAATKTPTSA